MVHDVEAFGPELHLKSLPNRYVFQYGSVEVDCARSLRNVSPRITELAGLSHRIQSSIRSAADPLRYGMRASAGISNQIRTAREEGG